MISKLFKINGFVGVIVVVALSFLLLLGLTKGEVVDGELRYQYSIDNTTGGPFEATNTTSRYELTRSIAKNGSFFLNSEQAENAAPDVVELNGKFLTIFTPGISFIAVPLYLLGEYVKMPQLLTFFSTICFAILNFVMVFRLSRKFGARTIPSLLSGFIFTFATNALVYALTLTQHHASTFIILASIINALSKRNALNNIIFGVLFAAGALIDIPNVFMLFPLLVYILSKQISFKSIGNKVRTSINFTWMWVIVGMIPLLLLFLYYNYATTGTAFTLAQNVGRAERFFDEEERLQIQRAEQEGHKGSGIVDVPFKTRNILNGFYILLVSDERSWVYYSPVLLIGAAGLWLAFKRVKTRIASVLAIAIISVNIIIYSMFGDPWGGWSFGPRYLIPSASILAASLGLAIERSRKNFLSTILILILVFIGIYISTLGAMTTSALPPKNEAAVLTHPIPYTIEHNLNLLQIGEPSTLIYNAFFKQRISLAAAHFSLTIALTAVAGLLLFLTKSKTKKV